MLPRQFDVVIERNGEGYYVASVPQLPACHTQARSLEQPSVQQPDKNRETPFREGERMATEARLPKTRRC
jgi:hypothetical protein